MTRGPANDLQFINIKALNEWDSRFAGGVDWRQKLDVQPGAVLANELKHNACKLAKWTVHYDNTYEQNDYPWQNSNKFCKKL